MMEHFTHARRMIDGLVRRLVRRRIPSATKSLIGEIRGRHLTYLSEDRMMNIASLVGEIDQREIPGLIMEAGCALGGSSILMSRVKSRHRAFRIHDVFGMIPAPSESDPPEVHERYEVIVSGRSQGIDGDRYYGYETDLESLVRRHLESFGVDLERDDVTLVKGFVQDTIVGSEPIAFLHVDVDWYEPVKTCLERCFPRMSVGGHIVLDDYFDWESCRSATDEFLASIPGRYRLKSPFGALIITRTA